MDRTYVNQHRKTPVFQLGLDLWYEVVIRRPVISDRLRGLVLDMIHRERVGELVEKSLIRSMTKASVVVSHECRLNAALDVCFSWSRCLSP